MRVTLKKFVRVAMMAAALTAGNVMGMGCSTDGGNTGNEQDKDKDNPGKGDNENPGNDNPDNDKETSKPYTIDFGNGNYQIHNFTGEEPKFLSSTVVDDVNNYLGQAETYMKGLANDFNRSLNGRNSAQSYFAPFINSLQNNDRYVIAAKDGGADNIDRVIENNNEDATYIFEDIIENLGISENKKHNAFIMSYKTLAYEAYKTGLGTQREFANGRTDKYQRWVGSVTILWSKNVANGNECLNNINLEQDIAKGCVGVTNIMDELLSTAVQNFNNRGINLNINDLRQVINIELNTMSMNAMHDNYQDLLEHSNACNVTLMREFNAMENKRDELFEQAQTMAYAQNQGMEM